MSARLTYISGGVGREIEEEFERRLAAMRKASPAPFAHIIAGRHVEAGEIFERRDPSAASRQIRRAHAAGPETVAAAISAARGAQTLWRRTPYIERCRQMRAVVQAIGERRVEVACAMSLETGKTRTESLAETQEAIDLIETYCAGIEELDGFSAPLASLTATEQNLETLRPYGVFGVISPFNFPLALAVNMLSAALITGNTVVLKPSQATPWTAALLGEALAAGELPAGAFNLLQGGADTGRALAAGPVDGVAFTGSALAGREIARTLAEGPWARPVLAEMGGKNPAIVTAAADLDKAAEGLARAAFGLSGQKCSACSRAIVFEGVHDELLERLCAFTSTLRVGDAAEPESALGPVIDERAVARFEEGVALARRDGRVAWGGRRLERDGNFVEPTVVCELPSDHSLNRRELFLPFLSVTRVANLDDAIAEANAVEYGLSAGIFSEQPAEVEQFLEEIEAGVVYVNRRAGATTGAWPGSQSFCGWKASGLTGKGGLGPYYLQQFMREQSRTIAT
jgi:1-pyrroline-5-carboxylate dehydrogenase